MAQPKHRALLVGASDYSDSPSFGDLPFVRDDLQRLREVLIARGFETADILENRRGITLNTVRGAVHRFLGDARTGDTLVIVLSGHGIHIDGKDYLVPEDAPDAEPFTEGCIEIGWHKEVERSRAQRVIFLIDACREGRMPDTKSIPGTRGWKPPEIIGALRRKVAYVHACAAPRFALFVRETDTLRPGYDMGAQTGESFSIFSRAVADVITADPHALRLREFAVQVQERVDEYYRAYGKPSPPQQVKVTCETDADGGDFPFLPGAERRTEVHPWVRGVDEYPWHRTPEGPSRETLRDICRALAERLAQTHDAAVRALSGDPWRDGDLAARTHKRLGFLVSRLTDGVRLSPTESALTYLFPLIAQTFWAQEAAQRVGVLTADPTAPGPDLGRFHKFEQGFPRLKRRLTALEHQRAAAGSAEQKEAARASMERIRWWLFHRWLIQQPELYSAERLKELLGDLTSGGAHPQWVTDALSPERLTELLREHRAAPFSMRRSATDPPPRGLRPPREDRVVIAASTLVEQVVRTPLVTALVKAAQAMAVDPLDLPEIVVEHVGIHDSVDLDQLLTTVRHSDWQVSGLGRSLNAVCTHPAVQVALREHAARVDVLLRDINRGEDPALDPLEGLPPYADGSRVRPAGNTPDELSDGIRFQLAEDRVQELLMGEELYGDSELAVRELYQNALDAVRYRDRRTEYLRRTDRPVDDWEGRITFTQGVRPDGRRYLECRDNGIGMGITELSTVFSQGGARFVDLPEYIEEQAAWAELPGPKLRLHPNSRFGIGVLSYFMLADEIVVRTCRMGREDGRPRRLLQVTIAGPGNFFRVEDKGEGRPEDIGTTVTLLLGKEHRSVSCVEALGKVLWVAPYRTVATHGARSLEWRPGELSRTALATYHPYRYARRGHTVCIDSEDPDLWWVESLGALLVDGVFAESDTTPYGAVVNLSGEKSPELTVDRKTLRSFDLEHVKARVIAAVPSLTASASGLPTASWLEECSSWSVPVADAVAEHIRRTDMPWQLTDGCSAPFNRLGFFPPDIDLLPLVTGDYKETDPALSASFLANFPLPVLRWRLRTLYRAGFGGPVSLPEPEETDSLCARPSDLVLLCAADRTGFLGWSTWHEGWLKGPRSSFFITGSAPSQPLADTGWGSLGLMFPWRDPAITVSTAEVFRLSSAVQRAPADIAERLTALGFRVDPLSGCSAARCEDLPLLRPLGDLSGWLSPGATLTAAQISVSAAQAACSTSQAARRLAELGFAAPAEYPVKEHWTKEERSVVKELWTSYATPPSPREAVRVSAVQLREVTYQTDLPLRFVSELLSHLGFLLPPDASALPELTDDDRVLIDSAAVRADREVPLRYMVDAARRLGRPVHEVAVRLRELGYAVPEVPDGDQLPTPEEITLLGIGLALADTGRPVTVRNLVTVASRAGSSLTEAANRLASLGYRFRFDPAAFAHFRKQDVEVLSRGRDFGQWLSPEESGPVSLGALHAAAAHIGKDHSVVAASLKALGFDVVPETEDWAAERAREAVLSKFINLRNSDQRFEKFPERSVSLVTLAVVAMRAGKSLREVAMRATEWGTRHEAETWFTLAAAEPPAPSACATPPPATAAPPHGC
ncbi:caspase family protein [Streptomyces sp. NPDC049627]|uniref:wHTH domain-containing protein n=1 Tax=Streptomyces sp. NPDC049627 TaxID=3365595 RepID=UPI0037A698A3